jgi:MFS family permease
VLASVIVADTGWSLGAVIGRVSLGLLTAGLVSPRVCRIIQSEGGRRVLTFSSIAFAACLAVIGVAPSLPVYLIGWLLIGLAMGAGL